MSDNVSGNNSPATMADDSSIGTSTWNDVDNAKTQNDTHAYAVVGGANITEYQTRLVVGGTISGDIKTAGVISTSDTDTYATYGGDGDLWGLSLTTADVNASNFGVVYSAQGTNITHYLKATNFGFAIPASDIVGVRVSIDRWKDLAGGTTINVDHIYMTIYYNNLRGKITGISSITGISTITF